MNTPSKERWLALWKAVGASGDASAWHSILQAAYAGPHRFYHNQQHLAECLAQFDSARLLAAQPEAVELGLWFHDAVYDPRAADNEEQSSALARRCLTEAGVDPAVTNCTCRLVMATKTHALGDDADTALLVDVDLSILGQPLERFLEYEAQIREEYAWVPNERFTSGRRAVLEGFLARERIFRTSLFRDRYEDSARSNLTASIHRLGA